CRSSAALPIPPGPTTRMPRERIPTAPCTSWTSTRPPFASRTEPRAYATCAVERRRRMKRLLTMCAALGAAALALSVGSVGSAPGDFPWSGSVPFTNVIASTPTNGAGYPVPTGSRVPVAGTCGPGPFNSNHSESWLAVKPGTEDLVGSSKFFFDKYSTFYMFYLGAHQIVNGAPVRNNQIQGYDCLSTGTGGTLNQDMPPSWTDTTDPNLDFDTTGRVWQTMAPFNSFFDATKLPPEGEIDLSFSDDLGRTWVKGNGGRPLEPSNTASAKQAGPAEGR